MNDFNTERQSRYLMVVSFTLLPILSLVLITVFVFFHPIFEKMEFIADTIYEEIRPVRVLQKALITSMMGPNDYLLQGKMDNKKLWEQSKDEVNHYFKVLIDNPAYVDEKSKLLYLRQEWNSCMLLGDQIFQLKVVGLVSKRSAELMEEFDLRVETVSEDLDSFASYREEAVSRAYSSIHDLKTKTIIATLGAILLGMISGVFGSIWLARNRKQMIEFVTRDALTGAYNRRALDDALHQLNGDKGSFAALLLDLDNFKSVNDTYGHDAGDLVLKYFVEETQKVLRSNDLFGRYGGEEFLILLYDTKLEHAAALAERIRKSVESNTVYLPSSGAHHSLTVSIGCAASDGSRPSEETVRMADKAMYKAKQSGRNQVVVAE
ncbi:GGDEF domain-containing protein [Maridesulfovibrio salexigens]|uniref:diguanylate cyclase n=1 Tax=Maridesulfovibrio salexigens (strain ATCC 14822 / DSM 2638 / NCIMB 8403 / VKM B-1763) TaxID=526222 RepID=C6C017_MARSD|nr:GGDEF domain-containing protein [Maridesulfovibrio salexigens]ACS80888.1 diguanylate cyclase [Maridesulfovibrio salexigens DSM 2638]